MKLKKFGEFIFEGKEHSFANKVVRAAQELLSDEEQDDQTLYEKIVGWAINYYDNNEPNPSESACLDSIKPKIAEYRVKQSAPKVKGKKKSDEDEEEDD